jgi:hypothetical protein
MLCLMVTSLKHTRVSSHATWRSSLQAHSRWSFLMYICGHATQSLHLLQVDTTEQALQVLAAEPAPGARAAGVMIGRAAWKRPWDCFSDADRAVFGADSNAAVSRRQVSS